MVEETKSPTETQFDLLIDRGREILKLFAGEREIAAKHIAIIRQWVESTVDFIEPIIGEELVEGESVKNIRRAYEQVTCILPGDPDKDIKKILSGLRRGCPGCR